MSGNGRLLEDVGEATAAVPGKRGRPRIHASPADRIRSFRDMHGLQHVTLGLPKRLVEPIRKYASLLRELDRCTSTRAACDQPSASHEVIANRWVSGLIWREPHS